MPKRILIVGAGANQVPVVRRARDLDLYTVAMDGDAKAPGLALADAAAVGDICSGTSVERAANEHQVDGIFPAAEWGVEATAYAAAQLDLPGIIPESARCVRDKFAMRERLAAAGVPVPAYAIASTATEAEKAAGTVGLPLVVKPADGNASRGVQRLDQLEDLPLAFAQAQRGSRSGRVLLEAFMDGVEYNVDGLVYEGRFRLGGMTGKALSPPPYRFDMGIFMPPPLDGETEQAIIACVQDAIAAIGLTIGAVHAEVMVTADGPRIVEMAGRPGGGRIPTDLIPLAYGIDYVADALRLVLGEAPRETRQHERGAALYWIPASPGIVQTIQGLAGAAAMTGVHAVVMMAKPGKVLRHLVDCAARDQVGYVLTSGATAEDAVATAKRAIADIHITTVQAY